MGQNINRRRLDSLRGFTAFYSSPCDRHESQGDNCPTSSHKTPLRSVSSPRAPGSSNFRTTSSAPMRIIFDCGIDRRLAIVSTIRGFVCLCSINSSKNWPQSGLLKRLTYKQDETFRSTPVRKGIFSVRHSETRRYLS